MEAERGHRTSGEPHELTLDLRRLGQRLRLRDPWIDLLGALLLSLATLTSAWCAYQAARWSSHQSLDLIEMNKARSQAAVQTSTGIQLAALDAGMFIQYAEAVSVQNTALAGFLYERFRPEMRVAVDAWLATNPLSNPDAPPSPLAMPEYVMGYASDELTAEELRARGDHYEENAEKSSSRATKFVGFASLAAVALFLGGISGKFPTRTLRIATLAIAWIFLLTTIGVVTSYTFTLSPLEPFMAASGG